MFVSHSVVFTILGDSDLVDVRERERGGGGGGRAAQTLRLTTRQRDKIQK